MAAPADPRVSAPHTPTTTRLFVPAGTTDRPERRFLPEIQGLRALAVGLVVVFHLWPATLTGGFVGVDVFFVISGYLITSHLVRELDRTGRIRLAGFYARRLRRLLPASLLVLAVTGVAAALVLPPQLARSAGREVIASTLYVENLWLAGKAVTYSASNDVASPVQHYWSLSTEEQFYAVWPALILLGAWLGRRWLRGRTVVGVAVVLFTLTAASLVHSVVFTAVDPAAAYFVTTTRVWEFAAGALTSFFLARWVPGPAVALALRWGGIVAIIATSVLISQATPFPGAVALAPVLGTAAVIVAGDTGPRDPIGWVSGLRPVQWLGDVSYSIYLWHWPLIALVPFVAGHALTDVEKVVILVATGVLADLSRRFVEQPFLDRGRDGRRTVRTFVGTTLAMGILAGSAWAHGAWLDRTTEAEASARIERLADDPCLGASATRHPADCDAFGTPLAAQVSEADSPWLMPACDPECWTGERPDRVVVAVGDSHAQNLYHALEPVLAQDGVGLAMVLQGACPLNVVGSDWWAGETRPAEWCGEWSRDGIGQVRDLAPDAIVVLAYKEATWLDPAAARRGFEQTWTELGSIAPVTVVRDFPRTVGSGPECLAVNATRPGACGVAREDALAGDLAWEAASAGVAGVATLDLTDAFCDADRCHAVVGGLPVYYDRDHISGTFARSLAPLVAERLLLP